MKNRYIELAQNSGNDEPMNVAFNMASVGPVVLLLSFTDKAKAMLNTLYFWVVLLQLMSLIKWNIVT